MIKHRLRICAIALVLLFDKSCLLAQGSPERPVPAESPSPAMIRAFVFPGEGNKDSVQFSIKPREADAVPAILGVAEGGLAVLNPGYQPFKPGAVSVELRSGDKVLGSAAANLQTARAYSFVVSKSPSSDWQIKLYPDDPASRNAADRAMRVLNFPAGRETLITVDQGTETRVPGNSVQEFRAAAKPTGVRVSVLAPDGGPPAQTSVELDFPRIKSGYIVVVPDNLGRMRPQLIEGGYPEVAEVAPAAPAVAEVPLTPQQEKERQVSEAQAEVESQMAVINMFKARAARMGNATNSATFIQNKREAERKLAELKRNVEAARAALVPPPETAPAN